MMTSIMIGMPFLVLFMALVMGVPFVYYLKRDMAYDRVKDQPEHIRLKTWYDY